MAKSVMELRKKILLHIAMDASPSEDWYVGITNNPQRRLFEEHGVARENKKLWIYDKFASVDEARRVEESLIKLGCDGELGGGDEESKFVYAYKKSKDTDP